MTHRRTALILASDFAPLASVGRFRTQELCRHLPALGWRCIVLTYQPPSGALVDAALLDEIPPDACVHRVACPRPIEWPVTAASRLWHAMNDPRTGTQDADTSCDTHAPAATLNDRDDNAPLRPIERLSKYIDRLKHAAIRTCMIPDDGMAARPMMTRRALQIARDERVDLLLSSVPGFTPWLAAAAVARRTGLPLVVDYRDLWHGDVLRQWVGPIRSRIEWAMERRALRATSAVITVSPSKTRAVRAIDPQPDARCYETIVNGFDPNLAADIAPQRSTADRDTLLLVYAGKLYGRRTIEPLIEAIGRSVQSGRMKRRHIRLRVYGSIELQQRDRIDKLIARYAIADTIVLEGHQPHCETMARQLGADAIVVVVDPGPTSDGVIPAKLTEAIGLNRFVFAIGAHGDSRKLIDAYGHGRSIGPDASGHLPTHARIADVLIELVKRRQSGPDAFVRTAPSRVLPTRQDVARQFADVFAQALSTKRFAAADPPTPRTSGQLLFDRGAPTQ